MAKKTVFETYIGKKTNSKPQMKKVMESSKDDQLREISFSGNMKTLIDKKFDKIFDKQDKRKRINLK